jgi:hypothetical protein
MKNIILSIIGITMFTIIGCDNLPTEPISNGNENYSISNGQSNDEEVLNNDAVPVSTKDFIVKKPKSEYPLDSVLMCMNLTPEQRVKVAPIVLKYKNDSYKMQDGLRIELEEYTQIFSDYIKMMNLKPTDSNYKSEMKLLNRLYKDRIKETKQKFSDSLRVMTEYFDGRVTYHFTQEQWEMYKKWRNNPYLTCEFLKP